MKRSLCLSLLILISASCADEQPAATAVAPDSASAARSPSEPEALNTDLTERSWRFSVRVDDSSASPMPSWGPAQLPEILVGRTFQTPAGAVLAERAPTQVANTLHLLRFERGLMHVEQIEADTLEPLFVRKLPSVAGVRFVGLVNDTFVGVEGEHLVAWDSDNEVVWKSHVRGLQHFEWGEGGDLVLHLLHEGEDHIFPEMRSVDPRTGQTLASRSMSKTLLGVLNAPRNERFPDPLLRGSRTEQVLERDGLRVEVSDSSFPYLKVDVFDADGNRLWHTWENAGKVGGRIAASIVDDYLVVHTVRAPLGQWQERPNTALTQRIYELETGAALGHFDSSVEM